MNFLYNGCMMRRSTSTVTVLSILSLVTRPVRTRFGIVLLLSTFGGGGSFLRQDGFDASDLAPDLLHAALALVLAGSPLEAQVELLPAQIEQSGAELVG